MTKLALVVLGWAAILWMLWELRRATKEPPLPTPDHLSCGQCFWVTRAQRLGLDQFPANLPDQLVISTYCPAHGTFVYKRWGEKHLDDKGLPSWWDVDNYRGLLEGD